MSDTGPQASEDRARSAAPVAAPGGECGDRVGGGLLAVATPTTWPASSWSVLEWRMVIRIPPGRWLMSARSRAASSKRRIAEAKPMIWSTSHPLSSTGDNVGTVACSGPVAGLATSLVFGPVIGRVIGPVGMVSTGPGRRGVWSSTGCTGHCPTAVDSRLAVVVGRVVVPVARTAGSGGGLWWVVTP